MSNTQQRETPLVCPHLPQPEASMTHRCLTGLDAAADPDFFYFKALQYGHYLWQHGHAGRAILAIARALYTNLSTEATTLQSWPLPYDAIGWIILNHSSDDFPGNPRISFQHQATRMRGERQDLRRARAWAVWAIICKARPSLPADEIQCFDAPSQQEIYQRLKQFGHPHEANLWDQSLLGLKSNTLRHL